MRKLLVSLVAAAVLVTAVPAQGDTIVAPSHALVGPAALDSDGLLERRRYFPRHGYRRCYVPIIRRIVRYC